jgi:hypothetical protein
LNEFGWCYNNFININYFLLYFHPFHQNYSKGQILFL